MLTRHGIRDSVTARVAWPLFLYATVHTGATTHFASRGRSAGSAEHAEFAVPAARMGHLGGSAVHLDVF